MQQPPSRSTGWGPDSLTAVATDLIHSSLQPTSRKTYSRAMALFTEFVFKTLRQTVRLPYESSQIFMFIAHCFNQGLATSTVYTYVSAIGYYHKIQSLPDPTNHFVVKKCLQGYHNRHHTSDKRLPVTAVILRQLVLSLGHTVPSQYERVLVKAMYLLAFHAFLRVGEITASPHNLGYENVQFLFDDRRKLTGCEVSVVLSKHSNGKSHILQLNCNTAELVLCPVNALFEYCRLRGSACGPLFAFMDMSPISRRYFTQQFTLSVQWSGLSPRLYKAHSFRIGAATAAASIGVSEDMIQRMGRWSSGAFKKYIRIPLLRL